MPGENLNSLATVIVVVWVAMLVAAVIYKYPFSRSHPPEQQAFIAALLITGFLLLKTEKTENFTTSGQKILPLSHVQADIDTGLTAWEPKVHAVLTMVNNKIIDPKGWRWDNHNTISTTIKVKSLTGVMDYDNLIGRPQLGYPSKSGGFGYTNWNQLQGTNAWFALNESTGGNGWFWWKLDQAWHHLPEEQKHKELWLKLMITGHGMTPSFPTGYSLTIPDWSFDRSVRYWVEFSKDPMDDMPHPTEQEPDHKLRDGPPLMLRNTHIKIPSSAWTMEERGIAVAEVPIHAEHGNIDWSYVTGDERNGKGWFSWEIDPTVSIQSPQLVVLRAHIRDRLQPPDHFPARYRIEIKDRHRDRFVRATLLVMNNPFQVYRETGPKWETQESRKRITPHCPETQEMPSSGLRCRCQVPVLLRGLCPKNKPGEHKCP
jgi:hypothetical protein